MKVAISSVLPIVPIQTKRAKVPVRPQFVSRAICVPSPMAGAGIRRWFGKGSVSLVLGARLALWVVAASLSSDPPTVLQPVPLVVEAGRSSRADLPAGPNDAQYLVIVGSLSGGEQPVAVEVAISPTEQVAPLPVASTLIDEYWLRATTERHQRQQSRRFAEVEPVSYVARRFPERRVFYLFVHDSDYADVRNYEKVMAHLVAAGKHCLVYVDQEDDPENFDRETIDDIVETFDERVYPEASARFGRHRDVDRDGRFVILLTHWLDHLSNGAVSLGGFVRGGDFYRDIDAPFSNQCDMMYLNSRLRAGRHLRTLIAHEYTHAITFSEHVFGSYLPGVPGDDEQAWLSEAMAHLAENLAGQGWSNLDYRISTFLSSPAQYRLVVPDYHSAGLWRCHGCRGSTYLFLRWCVDQYGDGLLEWLSRSNLGGIENLEAATRTPFAELFRGWSLALALDGLASPQSTGGYRELSLHGRIERRLLGGMRPIEADVGEQTLHLAPTSVCSLRVQVPAGTARSIDLQAYGKDGQLQVTVVRLPDDLPVVDLELLHGAPGAVAIGRDAEVRLRLRHRHGAQVHWQTLTAEPLAPATAMSEFDSKHAWIEAAANCLNAVVTSAGQTVWTDPLGAGELFSSGPVIVKCVGIDAKDRPVTAWGLIDVAAAQP